ESLEEIVRQEGVLGDPAVESGHERIDVVEAFSGEGPFVEQVLVSVRDGRRVGIDARMPGVYAGDQRSRGARHRHADVRLLDAVPVRDPAETGIEDGTIQRM